MPIITITLNFLPASVNQWLLSLSQYPHLYIWVGQQGRMHGDVRGTGQFSVIWCSMILTGEHVYMTAYSTEALSCSVWDAHAFTPSAHGMNESMHSFHSTWTCVGWQRNEARRALSANKQTPPGLQLTSVRTRGLKAAQVGGFNLKTSYTVPEISTYCTNV